MASSFASSPAITAMRIASAVPGICLADGSQQAFVLAMALDDEILALAHQPRQWPCALANRTDIWVSASAALECRAHCASSKPPRALPPRPPAAR